MIDLKIFYMLVFAQKYTQNILNKERERIDLQLKDLGYYDFTRQYVSFAVDTAYRDDYQVALQLEIKNPSQRDAHKIFHVDSITFRTDAAINTNDTLKRQSVEKYGITFNYFKSEYSKKIPIELEHIDGNSENNNLSNLKLLCPNCHSLTSTYRFLNVGNGRYKRKQRYHDGKSF